MNNSAVETRESPRGAGYDKKISWVMATRTCWSTLDFYYDAPEGCMPYSHFFPTCTPFLSHFFPDDI